jgi:MFS family permease
MFKQKLQALLPSLSRTVWILAAGRLLSQIGTGFTLFYATIFFVNQVGLSATLVGVGLGSAQVSGVLGRFLGGSLADSRFWGRKRTLLLSAAVSSVADVVLALTNNFATLLVGNLLMGLGIGLYWPATEAAVADVTTIEQRNEAFAITRLADNLGLGIGVVLGGALIATSGNYRTLFIIDGISFVVFFLVIYFAVPETYQFQEGQEESGFGRGWAVALRDRHLMVFLLVNIFFTIYISQIQTTMPLYFRNYVSAGSQMGFSATIISALFTWHIAFAAICQVPIARFLNRFSRSGALTLSLILWAGGFVLVWVTGVVPTNPLIPAIFALGVLAIALVTYLPSASSYVADLAPESLRGVYLSLNSQCWAIGYFIGPPIGGWALDQSDYITNGFWLAAAASTIIGILILRYLNRILKAR